ncbi:MAG TPA: YafY family protein [Gammaproteobacteria bacterium]|jgi:predicted DNA-binding transcriptional regulator YafY|nr:YafY family transcriptional regulator [Xanthomonadales bacterium]HOP21335.1 YafY family protein [Gammaproteobacteria bacterium]MCB1595575.1 YafY family transcriptional regulator [Xanthomonadales bacterium]MCB1603029.1 YafY family transcriptional regulator [Xanthomonadales bacterium]HPI94863.1 YafY family protein [Gammaproteobacteria bacterium]
MKKHDKIYLLDQMLKAAKYPISKEYIAERLECSIATVYRTIGDLRDGYGAPIETDANNGGFYYHGDDSFELPGLRLQSDEIEALLMASHLLEDIQKGLLKEPLLRLLNNISNLLKEHGIKDKRNIQIIYALFRKADPEIFSQVFQGLQNGKKLQIEYLARSTKETSQRSISPLKLTNYKNAWYLDSWCHLREAIRSFALEQIVSCKICDEPAIEVNQKLLKEHFSGSYGIFSGEPKYTARLKVSEQVAGWVAKEQWHSKQNLMELKDGSLFLEVPYNNDTELVMDILRYGENITVLSPDSLREKVKLTIEQMQKNYQ